jgi:uncharacterized protein (DUF697 family)
MVESDTTTARAETTVQRYMLGAVGVGLVPLPLVDMAALVGLQLKMLHSLATVYKVEFSSQLGKSFIASLLGGGMPVSLSFQVARFAVKRIPLYGWVAGLISTSVFGGASTYAIGKVFIQHFESGGTFLTFDPQQVKDYYAQQFARGKEEVRQSFVGIKP